VEVELGTTKCWRKAATTDITLSGKLVSIHLVWVMWFIGQRHDITTNESSWAWSGWDYGELGSLALAGVLEAGRNISF